MGNLAVTETLDQEPSTEPKTHVLDPELGTLVWEPATGSQEELPEIGGVEIRRGLRGWSLEMGRGRGVWPQGLVRLVIIVEVS